MNGIKFAEPLFLYLLVIDTGNDCILFLKQQKVTAFSQMPGLHPFAKSGTTFRHYLRHILFALSVLAIALLIIILARPQKTDKFQDISTEGIDIVLAQDISGSMLARDFNQTDLRPQRMLPQNLSQEDHMTGSVLLFSAEKAFTQCPLTTDHAVLINLLREDTERND